MPRILICLRIWSPTAGNAQHKGEMVDLIPDFSSRVFLAVGGILGALCSFLFGPIDDAIEWLFVFIVVDYLSGTYAAMKTGQWNSRTGFLGITKKIVMLSLVALCHGLDITSVIPFVSVRDAAVFAFCLNDFGCIRDQIPFFVHEIFSPFHKQS